MSGRLHQDARRVGRRFNGRVFWVVFIVMMIAVVIYASRQPRVYEARGELEIRRIVPVRDVSVVEAGAEGISCGEDLNTVSEVVASQAMLRRVTDRLSPEERNALSYPYGRAGYSEEEIKRLILANRTLTMVSETPLLEMRFRHRDRLMASRIVELFLDESVAYEADTRMQDTAYAVRMLTERAEQVAKQVESLKRELVVYRKSRTELAIGAPEADEMYQTLLKRTQKEEDGHKMLLERLSDAGSEHQRGGWWISQAPTLPSEDDYLRAPIFKSLAWGALLAAATAALAAIVFKRQGVGINQQEDL